MKTVSLLQYKKTNGIVIYEGPSVLDESPIICIATGLRDESANPKTGNLVQTWILNADKDPITTYVNGEDNKICGDCKHRSVQSGGWGTCYVSVFQSPNNIYHAWKNDSYENLNTQNISFFIGRKIRLGAYGDPAMVPITIWNTITWLSSGWTGYTHQWRNTKTDKELKRYCMASVDTKKEKEIANSRGWRTFRVRDGHDGLMDGEFICPASNEAGNRLSCETCMACHGGIHSRKGEPVIIAHGRKYKISRFQRIMKNIKNKKGWKKILLKG